jgi:hypothetical protein
MQKLTPSEIRAYRDLAEAARKLRQAQRRAEQQRARAEKRLFRLSMEAIPNGR